ncbi:MAG: UbiD family decarboxylase [Acidobacteriota bacterium]|nr:UbiD family decarboxylase [Acidobacteriota bacterium]
MIETLEKTGELKTVKLEKDTWILEVPAEVCRKEGFAEGTLVSLTFENGGIRTSYIRPSTETKSFLDRVIEEEKEYFEEMKRIGD